MNFRYVDKEEIEKELKEKIVNDDEKEFFDKKYKNFGINQWIKGYDHLSENELNTLWDQGEKFRTSSVIKLHYDLALTEYFKKDREKK